ncbi:MAG: dissimilatory-type sulfite reductase subunit beta [Deltaproteobacteria bacterium]|nr:dissimilatory-type sulfite reductase subunit beta [Deltaproteobacteria bacterium]
MTEKAKREYKTVEHGPYDYRNDTLHPVVLKNYGKWKHHDNPRPGVLVSVAESGDVLYTVRAGTARQITVDNVRTLCDLADKHSEGYMRFTVRNNVELMTTDESRIDALIADLEQAGFPVGGTSNTVTNIHHTQGWLHCDIPATDASGVVKSMMDELMHEFRHAEMPAKVRLSTGCCAINCSGQADIAVIVKHTRPPRINHETLAKTCELPKVVARCPVAAIRPTRVDGRLSLEVVEEKCMYCGACFGACPSMEINHPEHSKIAIWVGGKNSNARTKPAIMKMVAHGLPNNPPRWPEVNKVVKDILMAYKKGGRPYERLGEWIERIGWKRFFEETGLSFDVDMIDSYRMARTTFNKSAHIRF